jgi:hypothetical protein
MKGKFTICLSVLIFAFLYLISGSGCINVDNPVIQPVDYRSSAKFVNLRSGASLTVYVDKEQKGTLLLLAMHQHILTFQLVQGFSFLTMELGKIL